MIFASYTFRTTFPTMESHSRILLPRIDVYMISIKQILFTAKPSSSFNTLKYLNLHIFTCLFFLHIISLYDSVAFCSHLPHACEPCVPNAQCIRSSVNSILSLQVLKTWASWGSLGLYTDDIQGFPLAIFFFSIKYPVSWLPCLLHVHFFFSHFSGINPYSFLCKGLWPVKFVISRRTIRCLTTGIGSEKCVVGWFRPCENIAEWHTQI